MSSGGYFVNQCEHNYASSDIINNIFSTHSDNGEYLWHVVPGVLLDDGDDLTQLLEQVLSHVLITGAHHTQEWRHHLGGWGWAVRMWSTLIQLLKKQFYFQGTGWIVTVTGLGSEHTYFLFNVM